MQTLRRYGFAILAFLLAFLGRAILSGWLGETSPYTIFIPAVLIAAWYGGFGAGIVATLLAALAGLFFWVEPYYQLRVHSVGELLAVVIFLLVGFVSSWLSGTVQ